MPRHPPRQTGQPRGCPRPIRRSANHWRQSAVRRFQSATPRRRLYGRKGMDIGDDLRLTRVRRCPAHALSHRNPHAGRPALERSDHQFGAVVEVEPCPVQVGQRVVNQRREVGGVGKAVMLIRQQRTGLCDEFGVVRSDESSESWNMIRFVKGVACPCRAPRDFRTRRNPALRRQVPDLVSNTGSLR